MPSHEPPNRSLRRPTAVGLGVVLALSIAACGSSNSSTNTTGTTAATTHTTSTTKPAASAQHLALEADKTGELKYNTTSLTAKAGAATLTLTNDSPLSHNVTIEDSSGKVVAATTTFDGGSHTIPVNLKPGTYKFFCSVPGHRMAGMEGTLTVQ